MEKEDVLKVVAEYLSEHPLPEKQFYAVTDFTYDPKDFVALVSTVLDRWLTEGEKARQLRTEIAKQIGVRYCILTNSGSSANLIAMSAAKDFWECKPGQKVITCATAFPTTVAPIIQCGLTPAFIDINVDTLGFDLEEINSLLHRDDVVGIILAHNLGFAHQVQEIKEICLDLNKFYIEDNCDAFGTKVGGKSTGSFGDLSTLSFYPAHHITTGEGGAVCTNNAVLYRLIQQYSNWGRDCWCEPGKDNTCNKRFSHTWETGLPDGYDHKYTFTKIGYNTKMTELQAAFGLSQIHKLLDFKIKRRMNYENLYTITKPYDFYLRRYELPDGCSPFGFPMLASSAKVKQGVVEYLEENGVKTRPLFAGNILKHPMMKDVVWDSARALFFPNSDIIMNRMFWIGCHPSVTEENMATLGRLLREYF